jgi:ribosome-associated toxin RatA of RatAB toxin-antitoxin module
MKLKKSIKIIAILLISFCFTLQHAQAKNDLELVEWTNPSPSFSELNLDIETVSKIIKGGQLIISHKPKDIELWTQGEIKSYPQVRFSSAMIIVDAPAEEVKKIANDTENYKNFMPQIRDSSISLRNEKHFMAHYTQQYNLGPFPLKAKFQWQHTNEKNGDISILLHKGDIDAAAGRYEFLKINEKQTLLVLTTWQDLNTAKLTYRMMIKANADFKAAFPAVASAILLLQYRDAFSEKDKTIPKESTLSKQPTIPLLTKNPKQLSTLIKLAKNGTLVLIEERQWYKDQNQEGKIQSIVFASAVRVMPANLEKAKPIILDLSSLQEFTKEIKKSTITDIENGKHVEAKLKIGLGIIGISLDFFFDLVEYEGSDNIRLLLNGGGDMYPMLGAYEFSGFQEEGQDYTFGVLTQGGSISEDAPYLIRLIAKKLPQFDFIRTIFSTLPQIEKQQIWVMEQLAKAESTQNIKNYK